MAAEGNRMVKEKTLGNRVSVRSQDALLSVVVPCYNEHEVINETHKRLTAALESADLTFEILYVNDGSRDNTIDLLQEIADQDSRVRLLSFARNFGHQAAVTAGVDHSNGDAIVIIDADLQDPPHVIAEMFAKWREGYDVVYGQRAARQGESAFKLATAKLFYRSLNSISDVDIPLDVGDFRLIDRAVADVLSAMPERDRFLRGMIAWLGFKQYALSYNREARFAGETKYPLKKMLGLAFNGVLSFSMAPLRFVIGLGLFFVAIAFVGAIYSVALRLLTDNWVSGWTLLFLSVMMMGGVQLVVLGAIGEYVGRIYMESKKRPLYIIKEARGFDQPRAKLWR